MTNWKNYAGSILLAGLLLQGCGSSEESAVAQTTTVDAAAAASRAIAANTVSALDDAQKENDLSAATNTAKLNFSSGAAEDATSASDKVKAVIAALVEKGTMSQADADYVLANTDLNELYLEAYFDKAAADLNLAPARLAPSRASILDSILDPIKDGLVGLMDTSIGGAVTSATFDVVLNSEGVTVFMLDLARGSETMTQIMIDALGRDWSLTEKMCPMLQTNQEFGEKFAALAEESEPMARFFFERVDAPMYGCLTDAMLLSNDDTAFGSYDDPVFHSTNGYMGILMERYATDFFIEPGTNANNTSGYGRIDTFAGLMFTTGNAVVLDGNMTTGHGDANELINEQFFYSTFKTATTTDTFVAAMQKLPEADVTMFMDEIFLGQQDTTAFGASEDKVQGYYNIISIAGGMYEGIETYGFSKYSGAFLGFAGLIPMDRYMSYGSQFMSAGYFWAEQNGISVWDTVTDGAKDIYANYTTDTDTSSASGAPARSGSLGLISSPWIDDTLAVFGTAWDQLNIDFWPENGFIAYYNAEAMKAYSTIIGSPDSNLPTELGTGELVNGFHGLIELAIREDMVNATAVADMAAAEAAFSLPAFSEITWDFAYTSAKTGVTGYWNNVVNAKWLADLSTTEFVQNYFYPSEDGIVAAYVPNWMMSIDWLKLPNAVNETNYDSIDLSFDGGYVDVYFVSTVTDLAQVNEVVTIELIDDSMIAQDADGNLVETRYLYKIRAVSPEQVAAALAYLKLQGEALIGIDTDNATQTVATTE